MRPHRPHASTTAHTTPAPQRRTTRPHRLRTSTTPDNTTTPSPYLDDDTATPLPVTTTRPRTPTRAMATVWPPSPAAAPSAQQQPVSQLHKATLHADNVATRLPTVPRRGRSHATLQRDEKRTTQPRRDQDEATVTQCVA